MPVRLGTVVALDLVCYLGPGSGRLGLGSLRGRFLLDRFLNLVEVIVIVVEALVLVARFVVTRVILTEDGEVPYSFSCNSGSGPTGSSTLGRAPVVGDLVEFHFCDFLSLFCRCGLRH